MFRRTVLSKADKSLWDRDFAQGVIKKLVELRLNTAYAWRIRLRLNFKPVMAHSLLRKSLHFILTTILISSGNVVAASATCPTYYESQQMDLWCWVAVSKMLLDKYAGVKMAQTSQVWIYLLHYRPVLGPSDCPSGSNCANASGGFTLRMLKMHGANIGKLTGDFDVVAPQDFDHIKNQLTTKGPFVSVYYDKTGSDSHVHFVVVYDASTQSLPTGTANFISIADPNLFTGCVSYDLDQFNQPGYTRLADLVNIR
jgi:hypothetical protein